MQYALGPKLHDLGLSIPPNVEEGVRNYAPICASCNNPQSPIGLDSSQEYAEWADKRAKIAPKERLSSRQRAAAFPGSRHTKCAACNDRLIAVVGLPTRLLEAMLHGLTANAFDQVKGFLEYRFIFLLCLNCASSGAEDHVTLETLVARYHKVRDLLAAENWDVTPAKTRRFTDRFFARLAVCIHARDAQSA